MLWNFARCLEFIHEVIINCVHRCAQINVNVEIGKLKVLICLSQREMCATGRQHIIFQLLCVTLLDHCMCMVQLAECCTWLMLLPS